MSHTSPERPHIRTVTDTGLTLVNDNKVHIRIKTIRDTSLYLYRHEKSWNAHTARYNPAAAIGKLTQYTALDYLGIFFGLSSKSTKKRKSNLENPIQLSLLFKNDFPNFHFSHFVPRGC